MAGYHELPNGGQACDGDARVPCPLPANYLGVNYLGANYRDADALDTNTDAGVFGHRPRRLSLLNRYDRTPPSAGEAEVKFLDGDFRIVRPGAFVRCAVTGVPIPLEELKYWSVEEQEAYASPEAVMRRLHPQQVK